MVKALTVEIENVSEIHVQCSVQTILSYNSRPSARLKNIEGKTAAKCRVGTKHHFTPTLFSLTLVEAEWQDFPLEAIWIWMRHFSIIFLFFHQNRGRSYRFEWKFSNSLFKNSESGIVTCNPSWPALILQWIRGLYFHLISVGYPSV